MAVRDQREARARENKHAHKGIDIPSCPGILAQLMEELRQPQVSGKHIATLIGKDVGLAAIVVRSANAPFFGSGRRIASIDDATALAAIQAAFRRALEAAWPGLALPF